MKKLMFIGLAALTLGLLSTACVDPIVSEEPIVEEENVNGDLCTITATFEGATKTSLNGLEVLWQTDDKIKVFNSSTPAGIEYTLSSGAGEKTATFTGEALSGDGPYYAVYPSTAAIGLSSTTVSLKVPETQKYAVNSFGRGANIALATSPSPDNFSFQNAGGALMLKLQGDKQISKINLYSLGALDILNGTLAINALDPNNPDITPGTEKGKLTLVCDTPVQLTNDGVDFYFIIPPGMLSSGFEVEIIDKDGLGMIQYTTKNLTITKNYIREMAAFEYSPKYSSEFLTSAALAGGWAGVNTNSISGGYYIDKTTNGQYALIPGTKKGVRVQNWADGYAITLTPSSSTFTLGSVDPLSVNVKVQSSTIPLDSKDYNVTVIKKYGGRSWLYDATDKTGYIITDAIIQ